MEKNEIKNRLFDVLNDTDNLPIQDIVTNDADVWINIYSIDRTMLIIDCESYGDWWLIAV